MTKYKCLQDLILPKTDPHRAAPYVNEGKIVTVTHRGAKVTQFKVEYINGTDLLYLPNTTFDKQFIQTNEEELQWQDKTQKF